MIMITKTISLLIIRNLKPFLSVLVIFCDDNDYDDDDEYDNNSTSFFNK